MPKRSIPFRKADVARAIAAAKAAGIERVRVEVVLPSGVTIAVTEAAPDQDGRQPNGEGRDIVL